MKKNFLFLLFLYLCFVFLISCEKTATNSTNNKDYTTELSEEVTDYLCSNSSCLDIQNNEDFSSFSMLDSCLNDYDIFLTGEQHATQKNYPLKLKFIKYLNKKTNLRYYLDENGYGASCLINYYLSSGDETVLQKYMNTLKGTASYSRENYQFYKNMRTYHLSLPESKRVTFIGIDVEHQMDAAVFALYLLLPIDSENEPPYIQELKHLYTELNNCDFKREQYSNGWYDTIQSLACSLDTAIENHEQVYQQYLGADFFHFNMIVENFPHTFLYYSTRDFSIREQTIYNNFLKVYEWLPDSIPKRFFGQWGGFHIYQVSSTNNRYGSQSFATRLEKNDDVSVGGKILSLNSFYHNSHYLSTSGQTMSIDYGVMYSFFLSETALGDVTLYNLMGKDSPFKTNNFLISSDLLADNHPTTDYFQYAILVKNSPAVTCWE
ncbi:MAG: hypothetical protein R6V04_06000 [bacterium]